MKHMAAVLGLCALVACGNAPRDPILSGLQSRVQRAVSPPAPPPSLSEQRSRVLADVAASGTTDPVLLVTLPAQSAVASLVPLGANGDAVTWVDPTGVSLTTRGGVMIATRGLGHDLMISDASAVLDAMAAGGGRYTRLYRHLDGEGQLGRLVLDCALQRSGQLWRETCSTADTSVDNTYTESGGRITESRQWVSPEIGYAITEQLR